MWKSKTYTVQSITFGREVAIFESCGIQYRKSTGPFSREWAVLSFKYKMVEPKTLGIKIEI